MKLKTLTQVEEVYISCAGSEVERVGEHTRKGKNGSRKRLWVPVRLALFAVRSQRVANNHMLAELESGDPTAPLGWFAQSP